MNDNTPSLASLLKHGCQVTHYSNTRGWIETPDGRFFKPEPNKVRFIKEMNKPFFYTAKINKGLLSAVIHLLKSVAANESDRSAPAFASYPASNAESSKS